VNANYNLSFDIDNNFSIVFYPVTGIAQDHTTGAVSQTHVDGMIRWLEVNRSTFISYYEGQISFRLFDAALATNPFR
jgi:hypothetical protein